MANGHAKEILETAGTHEGNRVSEGEDDTDSRYQRDGGKVKSAGDPARQHKSDLSRTEMVERS